MILMQMARRGWPWADVQRCQTQFSLIGTYFEGCMLHYLGLMGEGKPSSFLPSLDEPRKLHSLLTVHCTEMDQK